MLNQLGSNQLAPGQILVGDLLPVGRVTVFSRLRLADLLEKLPAVGLLRGCDVGVVGVLLDGVSAQDQALN